MRRRNQWLVLVFAALWLSACDRAPYSIQESGYWVEAQVIAPVIGIYWIDNDRIIFTGAPLQEGIELKKKGELFKAAINIWDTKKERVTVFAKRGTGLCYHNNYLRYIIYAGDDYSIDARQAFSGEGTLHGVTEKPAKGLTGEARLYTVRNAFTCRDFDLRQLPGYGDDMRRIPLREGHGYLEAGKKDLRSPDLPLRLFPPGNTQGIQLPLKQWQMTDRPITYLEFANVYFIHSGRWRETAAITTWPKDLPYPLHFLSPDGKVRTVEVPYIKGMSGGTPFYPMRDGIVASVGDDPRFKSNYLIGSDSMKLARFIGGEISPAVASPDGCKLAFAHTVWDSVGRPGLPTLKMINFCN